MSGRNRGPPMPIKGGLHEPPFRGRGLGPMPHPALLDEPQFGRGAGGPRPGTLIPHPAAIFEDRLALQHQDIQALLIDNQRPCCNAFEGSFEKVMKLEADLRASDAMRAEVMQVRADIQQLTAARQELTSQAEGLSQDLNRANLDLQQVPLLKGEIEGMRQELQRARAAIEYEKKGYAENYEHGQAMEKNLIAMAREMEKCVRSWLMLKSEHVRCCCWESEYIFHLAKY
ncbi:Protein FLX-like 1 [Vitis vinifera]|uniref:Protein FLX-like 1 n=1 Tax=Vitis vinifera TaxID=29760 RepID=A0A438D2D8_VITVI|nr:Protein FLX-like 1 [Vitis vinifera]